jgi:hypothetical protein
VKIPNAAQICLSRQSVRASRQEEDAVPLAGCEQGPLDPLSPRRPSRFKDAQEEEKPSGVDILSVVYVLEGSERRVTASLGYIRHEMTEALAALSILLPILSCFDLCSSHNQPTFTRPFSLLAPRTKLRNSVRGITMWISGSKIRGTSMLHAEIIESYASDRIIDAARDPYTCELSPRGT